MDPSQLIASITPQIQELVRVNVGAASAKAVQEVKRATIIAGVAGAVGGTVLTLIILKLMKK